MVITTKLVATARFISTPRSKVKAGNIKNPPPAPSVPLSSPTTNPTAMTSPSPRSLGSDSGWGMIIRVATASNNKANAPSKTRSLFTPKSTAGMFGTSTARASNAPTLEGIASKIPDFKSAVPLTIP